jgi:hypothetical protein
VTQNLGNLTIIANTNARFLAPTTGIKGLIIVNESGLSMTITMEGTTSSKPLFPSSSDYFPTGPGFTGSVLIINPTTSIGTALLYPGSFLTFFAVGANEEINLQAYPVSLNRPMSVGTQSGAGGFSNDAIVNTVGASTNFAVNLYNPKTSGIVARVYSLHVVVLPAPTTGQAFNIYIRNDGIDNALVASGDPPFAHNIGGATSKIKTTFQPGVTAIAAANQLQEQIFAGNQFYDYLGPPDCLYLNPGQNLLTNAPTVAATTTIVIGYKWAES